MEKVINAAVYGFTANQQVLLTPFIRKLWDISKIRNLTQKSNLKEELKETELLVVNGCLDFFELEFVLSVADEKKGISVACIAYDKFSMTGYDTVRKHDVPVVIAGLIEENDISICREKIRKFGTLKIGEPSEKTVESTCQEDFAKLSPKERDVTTRMLKGMKQDAIARELGISPSTVGTYFSRIYKKCGVGSQNELYKKFSV